MKINKLKLRGAIGIQKGLGADEIEIDFTKLEPGLIALTGKNGSGKTTIMENLHPYRCMVSRDGSLTNHFFLKDSYRFLEFEYENNIYESKILIDALTGGSEAYLICNGQPINDGKLTTYDQAIEHVLGSQELFFNSVFSGQKSKGIAELKPADRRKLFYELLNLNIYDGYLENAKAELKKSELKLAEITGQINSIEQNLIDESDLNIDLQNSKDYLELTNNKKTGLNILLNRQIEEVKNIELDLRTLSDKKNNQNEIKTKIDVYETTIAELIKSSNIKIKMYESDIDDNNKLIERAQKIIQNRDTIIESINKIGIITKSLDVQKSVLLEIQSSKNLFITESNSIRESLNKKLSEIVNLKLNRESLRSKITQTETELASNKKSSELISKVPCDSGIGSNCQFLTNAYSSKNMIQTLEEKLLLITNDYNALQSEILIEEDKSTSELNLFNQDYNTTINNLDSRIEEIELVIKSNQSELDKLNETNWNHLKVELNKAESDIELYKQKINSLEQSKLETKEHLETQLTQIKNELIELSSKIDNEIDDKIEQLNKVLSNSNKSLDYTKYEIEEKDYEIRLTLQEISSIESRIKSQKEIIEKKSKLESEKISIENEIKDWTFLVKAFDKTGIPVLKLENSGIEITSIANELLSLFDNKFRIVFETTSLTKDKKKLKETFDINIVEEDGVCEISNKSGGQQVWIETAIQSAISLVVRKQGRNIMTSFLDEKDGALDLDNALNYIQMLKKAHNLSGVHNTFIITHRAELLELIPQQVKLNDGYLQLIRS